MAQYGEYHPENPQAPISILTGGNIFVAVLVFLVAPFLENGATYLLSIVSVGMFVCMFVRMCVCL